MRLKTNSNMCTSVILELLLYITYFSCMFAVVPCRVHVLQLEELQESLPAHWYYQCPFVTTSGSGSQDGTVPLQYHLELVLMQLLGAYMYLHIHDIVKHDNSTHNHIIAMSMNGTLIWSLLILTLNKLLTFKFYIP